MANRRIPYVHLAPLHSFAGGLNLRASPFELAPNESPDMLNIDVDPRGGVELRHGVIPMPIYVQTPNVLLENESTFEVGVGGINPIFNCTVARDTTNQHTGTGCAKVTTTGATDYWFGNNDSSRSAVPTTAVKGMPVLPNTRYTFSSWVKASVARSVQFNIRWYNSAGTQISDTAANLATTTSWAQYVSAGASPATAAYAAIWWYNFAGVAGDIFYVDDVMFVQGSNSVSFLQPGADRFSLDGPIVSMQRLQVYGQFEQILVATAQTLWYIDFTSVVNVSGTNYWGTYAIGAWGTAAGFQFRDSGGNTRAHIVNITANAYYVPQANAATTAVGITVMGTTYNDNYNAPTYNNMPLAKYSAVHAGCAWVAWTKESGIEWQNRIRFSHPNSAGDWRSFDYIDVDPGKDGDFITAIVPFHDKLIVFKKQSTYAIVGHSPDTFAVVPISKSVGCVNNSAWAASGDAIYFFSWPLGVMSYSGGANPHWVSDKIAPLIDRGQIAYDKTDQIFLGWSMHRNRLWVSVPYKSLTASASPSQPTRTYVYDPAAEKGGAWMAYDLTPLTMYSWVLTGLGGFLIGGYAGTGRIMLLDWPGDPQPYDVLSPGVPTHIVSYYQTRWVDTGSSATKKNWKTPEFVLRGGSAYDLSVDVYADYDPQVVRKTFPLHATIDPSIVTWDTTNWGANWGPAPVLSNRSQVVKGSGMGTKRAISLKINGPTTNSFWGLNALTMKFVPRPPRS